MRTSSLLLVLAACGGGGSSDTIEVKLTDTMVAAVNTGDRWETVARDTNGTGKVTLDGPTMLATVCDSTYFNYYTLFLGPGMSEDEPLDLSCGTLVANVEVTIVAPTTTQVFIGFDRSFSTDPLSVTPGTHDVIAIDRSTMPPKFEIRRDLAITAAMTLTIAPSTPMVATRIDATPAAGETLFRSTQLITGNRTFASVAGTETNGWTFPASALAAGDKQTVVASTSSETLGTRSARREITADTPAVALELPGYLTTVTPTPTSVTWAGGAEWRSYYYGVNNMDFSILWDASVFPEWIEAGGKIDTIAFPDPAGIPGWRSEWNLGATAGYEWFFSASHETGGATRFGEL